MKPTEDQYTFFKEATNNVLDFLHAEFKLHESVIGDQRLIIYLGIIGAICMNAICVANRISGVPKEEVLNDMFNKLKEAINHVDTESEK